MVALNKSGKAMSVGLATLLGFHRLSEAVTLTIHLENRAMIVGQDCQTPSNHHSTSESVVAWVQLRVVCFSRQSTGVCLSPGVISGQTGDAQVWITHDCRMRARRF
jgi:hypothetical protein